MASSFFGNPAATFSRLLELLFKASVCVCLQFPLSLPETVVIAHQRHLNHLVVWKRLSQTSTFSNETDPHSLPETAPPF